MGRLLTVAEAAEELRLSRSSMYALIRRRGIEYLAHVTGKILVPEEAIAAYMEAIRVRPTRRALYVPAPEAPAHDRILTRSRDEAVAAIRERGTK